MQVRVVLAIALGSLVFYGCATAPETPPATNAAANGTAAAPAKSVPAPQETQSYRTGSRLPTRDEDAGASSVSGMSKDDYMDDVNRRIRPGGN